MARIGLTMYLLTVAQNGTGTGTVTSNPTGINCGADCTEYYYSGQTVTLTAVAGAGSVFSGWSGDCSGGNPLTVNMSGNTNCVGRF